VSCHPRRHVTMPALWPAAGSLVRCHNMRPHEQARAEKRRWQEGCAGLLLLISHAGKTLGATAHKVSILQDLERSRRLEVEEILGYAVRQGAELDLRLPTAETCYRLIRGIDQAR